MSKLVSSVSLAALLCGAASPAFALRVASDVFCPGPSQQVTFTVKFDALYENGVKIYSLANGRVAMTFNNYVGRGAGGEWRLAGGRWVGRKGACYRVSAQHKAGPANGDLPWLDSMSRRTGNVLGFEDGEDQDFNDAVVTVQIR